MLLTQNLRTNLARLGGIALLGFTMNATSATEIQGISVAGAEFAHEKPLPGDKYIDYIYPSDTDLDNPITEQGFNTVRIPFLWERLQHSVGVPLNTDDLSDLIDAIEYANSLGAHVIVGPHNYGRYYGQIIGESAISIQHFGDFWRRLAQKLKPYPNVSFSIMNEPHDQNTEILVSATNFAISEIRSTGANQRILVSGNHYSGAHSWNSPINGQRPNAEAMLDIVDPLNKLVFVAHQYLDADSSGRYSSCPNSSVGSDRLAGFTEWLQNENRKGIIEEFGAPSNTVCLDALDDMLDHIDNHDDVYIGWVYWATGPWWDPGYVSLVKPPPRSE